MTEWHDMKYSLQINCNPNKIVLLHRSMLIFLLVLLSHTASIAEKTIAITFDDLPVRQSGAEACDFSALSSFTQKLLQPFFASKIPLTGFVISGNCPSLTLEQRRAVLQMWLSTGMELGNHSHSHRSLNNMPLEEYQKDILRAETEMKQVLGSISLRYFRSPMLHTGATPEAKEGLEQFLKSHGYQQAPVTIDNFDFLFALVYSNARARGDQELAERLRNAYIPYMESIIAFFEERTIEVVGRETPQILLVHANHLNADVAPRLIEMMENRGYRFISLEETLQDPVYSMPNNYVGKGGIAWIHRVAHTKGIPVKMEPDTPEWVVKEYKAIQAVGK